MGIEMARNGRRLDPGFATDKGCSIVRRELVNNREASSFLTILEITVSDSDQ